MSDSCGLCVQPRELQISHIIPAFVWQWLRATSPGGIRGGEIPDRRIQDGPKMLLLCKECEQRFSAWESEFALKVFHPMHAGGMTPLGLKYDGPWALKSAVSVSWRVLKRSSQRGLKHLSPDQRDRASTALKIWADFLLDNRPHPGANEQHLIPLDVFESHTIPDLSPFINRYLTRTVDLDLIASEKEVLTYAKMGRALLIGWVIPPAAKQLWIGTKVCANRGQVGDQEMGLPENLLKYMNDRATNGAQKLAELSPRQDAKVSALFKEKPAEIASSDVFRAMNYDVKHAGRRAFDITHVKRKKPHSDGP